MASLPRRGSRRTRPLTLTGAALAATAALGCATSYDSAIVAERTASLFGTPAPQTPPAAAALPVDPELADYVRLGLERNPGLRAAYESWRAALEKIPQVSTLPDPVFRWEYFIEQVQTRTGPQQSRLGLMQTFPWFGKLGLRGEVAAKDAERRWWGVELERLSLVRRIKRAYFEYAYLAQAIRITADNLSLLQQLEPVVQRHIQAGGPQADLLRLQVEIGKIENDLETLQKFRPALSARLSAAINRPERTVLPLPGTIEPRPIRPSVDDLLERVAQHNPELEALRQEIERAQKTTELADLEGWPDVTLGVSYIDTGDALVPGTPGSGDDPYGVNIMFNLPIWRGKYAAASREAERRSAAARGELDDRRNTLREDLELAAYELDDADRQIALYRDTLLPRARQSFEVTQTSYEGGQASLLDVIDAERVLLAFDKAYWRAASNHEQSIADVEALCGGEIR
jgi:cobalt-zinc-cadmium efflux system outer membrane protein